ncbi:MAG: FAD-binding protein, partial [Melioribacteraceae bacterium]
MTTGDGIALAYFAGADLADLEFIQFHPTAFYSETGETFLVSEAVRGEGAFLLNENQERFMTAIDKRAELAPRDIVAKAIYEVIKNQDKKYIYLDAKNIPPDYFSTRFPNIFKDAKRFGFNLPEELLPVAPAAHYTIGGVKTDINSRTNVSGLYSCGETAANGIHGANRLASNSLLECLVFGKRAVDSAVNDKYDFKIAEYYVNVFKTGKEKEEDFLKIRNPTANLLNENAGILRDGKSLKKGLEIINELKRSFIFIENEYYS